MTVRRPAYLWPQHESVMEDVITFVAALGPLPFHAVQSRARFWLVARDADSLAREAAEVALDVWPRADVSPKELREKRLSAFLGAGSVLTPADFADLPALRPLSFSSDLMPTPSTLREEINRRRMLRLVAACWKLVVTAPEGICPLVRIARFGGLLVWPTRDPDSGLERVHFGGPLQALERGTTYARALCSLAMRSLTLPGATLSVIPERSSPSRYDVFPTDPVGRSSCRSRKFDSRLEHVCYAALVKAVGNHGVVSREPVAIPVGRVLAIPDFGITFPDGKPPLLLEVVGFWTESYLERKREFLRDSACRNWGYLVEKGKYESLVEGMPPRVRDRVFSLDSEIPVAALSKWIDGMRVAAGEGAC